MSEQTLQNAKIFDDILSAEIFSNATDFNTNILSLVQIVKGELTVSILKDIRNLSPLATDLLDKLPAGAAVQSDAPAAGARGGVRIGALGLALARGARGLERLLDRVLGGGSPLAIGLDAQGQAIAPAYGHFMPQRPTPSAPLMHAPRHSKRSPRRPPSSCNCVPSSRCARKAPPPLASPPVALPSPTARATC